MLKDVINYRVVSVQPDAKVTEVAQKMSDENIGAVLVCTDNQVHGIITDRDIVLRCIAKNIDVSDCTVEQILSEPVETVKETDGVYDCILKMKRGQFRRLPVTNDKGEVVGMVSFGDLFAVLSKEISDLAEAAVFVDQSKAKQLRAA